MHKAIILNKRIKKTAVSFFTYLLTSVSLKLVYHPNSNTRDNNYKLLNQSFHYDARKYCFSARIVNILNSLPNDVFDVNNVNQFKARLDKFWMHQDVKFDFTADLTGIGDRSVRVICDV